MTPMSQAPSLVRNAPIEKQLVTPGLGEAPVAPREEARKVGLQERPFKHITIHAVAMHQQHLTVPNPRPLSGAALEMGVDLGAALDSQTATAAANRRSSSRLMGTTECTATGDRFHNH